MRMRTKLDTVAEIEPLLRIDQKSPNAMQNAIYGNITTGLRIAGAANANGRGVKFGCPINSGIKIALFGSINTMQPTAIIVKHGTSTIGKICIVNPLSFPPKYIFGVMEVVSRRSSEPSSLSFAIAEDERDIAANVTTISSKLNKPRITFQKSCAVIAFVMYRLVRMINIREQIETKPHRPIRELKFRCRITRSRHAIGFPVTICSFLF